MLELLQKIEERYKELTLLLSDPQVLADSNRYKKVAKEYDEISQIMEIFKEYKKVLSSLEEAEKLKNSSKDKDLVEMAKLELEELKPKKEELENRLKILLVPKDPNDGKNVVMEIRAGVGGEEGALFVADLYRMYVKFAEKKGWKVETLNSNPTGKGGFKEIIFSIEGPDVYSHLKFESGIHRVQRVPVTEASGRIHTSASSVAVL